MNSTDNTALLTVLLAKHITSCDNVFLKGCFLIATYEVFRPIKYSKNLYQKSLLGYFNNLVSTSSDGSNTF